MSALQAALIGVVCALSSATIEGGWFGECKIREPIVTGALVGMILGNVKQGLIIGSQLELIWLGTASIGPVAGLSVGPGGTIGTAIALSTGAGVEAAMAFGVPVSVLLQFVQSLIDTAYSAPMHKVDQYIDEGGKEKQIIWIHWLCGILTFAFYWALTFVALYYGNGAINAMVNNLPSWASNGLAAVAKVLPALGFALLLSLLLEKDLIPYFMIGFALAAYLNMTMVGVAIVSIALAWIIYLSRVNTLNKAAAAQPAAAASETKDEEDEL
jgi:mannose/fructose/N-acetylgalactosamine-specific phosphotransferase system component IIC